MKGATKDVLVPAEVPMSYAYMRVMAKETKET